MSYLGDERYTFVADKVIRKVYFDGVRDVPDMRGIELNQIEELENGYTVYATPNDPSQPNPTLFVHKRYFVELKK